MQVFCGIDTQPRSSPWEGRGRLTCDIDRQVLCRGEPSWGESRKQRQNEDRATRGWGVNVCSSVPLVGPLISLVSRALSCEDVQAYVESMSKIGCVWVGAIAMLVVLEIGWASFWMLKAAYDKGNSVSKVSPSA